MTCATCGGRVLPDGDPYDPRLACLNCGRGAYLDGAAPAYAMRPTEGGAWPLVARNLAGRRMPRFIGSADALPRIRR